MRHRMSIGAGLITVLGLAQAWSAQAAAPPLDDGQTAPIVYEIKPGDNLFTLGMSYFVHPGDYRIVQRQNHVADPRRLTPGGHLSIPVAILKTRPIKAHIAALSGPVGVESDGHGLAPKVGLPIAEGMRLSTGPGAFLSLGLADESVVTLPSNTTMRVTRLREILLTGALQRVFALDSGRSDVSATPNSNPGSRFLIRSPIAVAAVRGTEFRVDAGEPSDGDARRTATGVLKGLVGVAPASGGGGEVATPAGFGVSTDAKGVGAPVKLLPAPSLVRGGRTQEDPELAFEITPVAGAGAYRLQLANDAGFIDIFAETETKTAAARFTGVPDGDYFARVTAIDPGGLEGLAKSYGFERDLNTLEPGAPPKPVVKGKHRRFLMRWSAGGEGIRTYRFQIFTDADGRNVLVDQPGLNEPQLILTDLPAGQYYWRITVTRFSHGKVSEKVGAMQDLRIGE